jgi:hypothetical protein
VRAEVGPTWTSLYSEKKVPSERKDWRSGQDRMMEGTRDLKLGGMVEEEEGWSFSVKYGGRLLG